MEINGFVSVQSEKILRTIPSIRNVIRLRALELHAREIDRIIEKCLVRDNLLRFWKKRKRTPEEAAEYLVDQTFVNFEEDYETALKCLFRKDREACDHLESSAQANPTGNVLVNAKYAHFFSWPESDYEKFKNYNVRRTEHD